jgi:hypothetical protein
MNHASLRKLRGLAAAIGILAIAAGSDTSQASAREKEAATPQWAARYVGMEVPKQVLTDQVFPARITVKNTGSAAWTGIPYSDQPNAQPVLYSQDPERNKTWGTDFAYMGQGVAVPPGQEFTFVSHFKAPSTAGEYGFQWRLARRAPDGKLVFFGQPTARELIAVRRRPEAPSPPRPARDPADKKVLDFDDFQYLGSFKVPEKVGEGGAGFSETGIALRTATDGGKRLLMNFTHPRQTLFEVEIPPLAKFEHGDAKPLGVARVKKVWGAVAMTIPKIGDIERISPNGGLWWDEGKKTLYWTFYHGYWTGGPFPVLAASKLGDDGRITPIGCWQLPKTVNKWKSYWGGVTKLPQAFAEKYTGGRTMALGFGGYYSICAGCSRGPALAALSEPDPARNTLDLVELLGYADPAAAPRDGNYFYGLGNIWHNVPAGPKDGSWTMDDWCRSGLLIDLPDKHGYIAFVRLATGRIGYDYGAIGAAGGCHWWYVYDPKDLGAVAEGRKKPGQVLPHSMTQVTYPDAGRRILERLQAQGAVHASGLLPPVTGSCFDERERTLYLLKPCAVEAGMEFHPCVHAYRVK